jgi:hypothetical protein
MKPTTSRYNNRETIVHSNMGGDVIKALCNLPSLKKLVIAPSSQFDVSDLAKCTAKEVEIYYMHNSTNVSTKDLVDMKNLEKLTLKRFILNSESNKMFQTVRYLKINGSHGSNFRQILSSFENLEHFECTTPYIFSRQSISDTSIQYPHLKRLKVDYWHRFSGKLVKFLDSFPNLVALHLDSNDIPFGLVSLKKLSGMAKLKTLGITFQLNKSSNLTPTVLAAIKKLCAKLSNYEIGFNNYGNNANDFFAALKRELPDIFEDGIYLEISNYCTLKSQ